MKEQKPLQDEPANQQDDYSFMQEVIKDETDSAAKIKSNIFRMIGYGIIFGVVASVVFCVSKLWIEANFHNNPKQVEIPKDEEDEKEESSEETKEDAGKAPNTDNYRQIVQSLGTAASNVKNSLVTVAKASDGTSSGKQDDVKDGSTQDALSGVIIADNGREFLILSTLLPVKKNEAVQVTFYDGNSYPATLKQQDDNLEIGVYAVKKTEIDEDQWEKISAAPFGNSYLVENGDAVIVTGRPFGDDAATSYGIVTADEEYVEKADGRYRLISTNISCEGSGSGVILNKNGQIVGLIDQSALGEGSSRRIGGYAISEIKDIIELLSNGSDIPYTGIYGMDVTDKLMKNGMPQGVYVKEVAPDSPAMAAGIQSGDVITGIDDESIVSLSNYHRILMNTKEGTVIHLNGCRQGPQDEYVEIDFEVKVDTTK